MTTHYAAYVLQADFLENLRHAAVRAKEHVCKRRPTDIVPFVVAHRGEDPIAQVTINGEINRDTLMVVFAQVAGGFDADAMGMVFESYSAGIDPETGDIYDRNPLTGEGWGYVGTERGGMQELAEEHDGLGKGWVVECLSISAINRAGDVGFMGLPYKYVGGKHLHWLEREIAWQTMEGGIEDEGYMTQLMREVMAGPSGSQVMPSDLSREERDVSVAQALARRQHAVHLFAEKGTARAELLADTGVIVGEFPKPRPRR